MAVKSESIAKQIGMTLLFLLALPGVLMGLAAVLLLLACVTPYYWVTGLLRERRFRKKLLQQGRLVRLAELASHLEAAEGTVIEEWGTKGACRIWWTGDDLASQAPQLEMHDLMRSLYSDAKEPNYEPRRAFNMWCLNTYIGGDSGKAILVPMSMQHAKIARYLGRFPSAKRVIVIPPPLWWQAN